MVDGFAQISIWRMMYHSEVDSERHICFRETEPMFQPIS